MTDTAREAQERMPVITEKHLAILAWHFTGQHHPVLREISTPERIHIEREIESLVRSLVSKETVNVDWEEMEGLAVLCEHAGEPNFYTYKGAAKAVAGTIRRWLSESTPTAASTKEERCPYGCPPERASACCAACWPAASTPTGESK